MIDFYATERHFVDHLAPIYLALPQDVQGTFWAASGPALARGLDKGVAPHVINQQPITRPVVVASYGDVKKTRKHGAPRKALLQHGSGQSYSGTPGTRDHGSYSGGRDHDEVSLFLCPNQMSAARWLEAYPEARVAIIGSPRVETLPHRAAGDDVTIAVSTHWQCGIVPETQSAFAPFRPFIRDLKSRWRVIGHSHPRAQRFVQPWFKRYGIPYYPDFEDVCKQADVYVCDNSSTIYEFAATDRPVVLMNAPWYRKNVEHGLRFWSHATVGLQVDDPKGLVDAVSCSVADPPGLREERRRIVSQVYSIIDGATEAAVSTIMEWAS